MPDKETWEQYQSYILDCKERDIIPMRYSEWLHEYLFE